MSMVNITPAEAAEHSRRTKEGMERARATGKQIGSAPLPIWNTEKFHAVAREVEKRHITIDMAAKSIGVSKCAFRIHYIEAGYKPAKGQYTRRLSKERRLELAGLLRMHKRPEECAEIMGVPYWMVRNEITRVLNGGKK